MCNNIGMHVPCDKRGEWVELNSVRQQNQAVINYSAINVIR